MNLYSFKYLNLTMAVGLGKQIAIVELFKAGKPQKEICKDLKVNRMLVWRTLKRYKESGNVQNQPGQGCPRSASTSKLISLLEVKDFSSQSFSSDTLQGKSSE